ncbi:MAG TPA: hypothetical protein VN040_26665 [Pseudosphingobacterium sp.]|nr:hypothetical protein [Pseudosphingobacterium sp.]
MGINGLVITFLPAQETHPSSTALVGPSARVPYRSNSILDKIDVNSIRLSVDALKKLRMIGP